VCRPAGPVDEYVRRRDGCSSVEVPPSWYLVASNDEAIPPDAERMFAQRMGARTVEASSGHLAMISHPAEVVALIERRRGGGRRSSGESTAVAQDA